MERISRSMDAALTAIYIMTSPKMPKQVFLDDVIERIIMFGKFQLNNTIYPEFDPVYRIQRKDKGESVVVNYQFSVYAGFALPVAIIAKCEEKIFLAQKKTLFGENKW